MKENYQTPFKDFISKPEINFWIPIVFTAISITMSFMTYSNKIALQNQKLDQVIANQVLMLGEYKELQARVNLVEKDIAIITSKNEELR